MSSPDTPVNKLNKSESTQDDARADVSAAVEELLNSLSNKFAGVSSEIFAKMDEMSRRLDNLEAALQESKAKEGSSSK
ncbi:heat shock factor binding protein 1-domain-containing protein [Mariannaea sp. PMI_226]|nr:heat shock factor binding protein 1-domain-containing protein [Mariannaea sp. PMI_226]